MTDQAERAVNAALGQAIAVLRDLAEKWKKSAAISRETCQSFAEMAAVRERCARELLDVVFEIESGIE